MDEEDDEDDKVGMLQKGQERQHELFWSMAF